MSPRDMCRRARSQALMRHAVRVLPCGGGEPDDRLSAYSCDGI